MKNNRKIKVYLDNCCYNRPYDDSSILKNELEARAKIFIQDLIIDKKIELYISGILIYENNKNPYDHKRNLINKFLSNAKMLIKFSDEINKLSLTLQNDGIKHFDAIHIAYAIQESCDYFITTDYKLIKYETNKIDIINPIDFIKIWEENDYDD